MQALRQTLEAAVRWDQMQRNPAKLAGPNRQPSPRPVRAFSLGLLDLNHFRRREWAPAIEAAAISRPARIYDLRSTFASDALAAGVGIHALARIMGTSVRMIERHYGALLDGAAEEIAGRPDAFEAERERAAEERSGH